MTDELSLQARGALPYLLNVTEEEINVDDAMKLLNVKRHTARMVLNELCDNGYARKWTVRDNVGRFLKQYYTISPKCNLRITDNGDKIQS